MSKDSKHQGRLRRKTPEEQQRERDEAKEAERADHNAVDDSRVATFSSVDVEGASLYWKDQFWSHLTANGPKVSVNTFVNHKWNVRKDNQVNESIDIESFIVQPICAFRFAILYLY